MKFIFQTMPAFGHLNPMLGVVGELVNRGHRVLVYNAPEFRDKIKHVGAEFREVTLKDTSLDISNLRILHNALTIADFSLRATKLLAESLIHEIEQEKPDCLLHDSLSVWGKIAGLKTQVPTVSLVPSMAINPRLILSQTPLLFSDYLQALAQPHTFLQIIRQFRAAYSKRALNPPFFFDIFSNREKLNIVFTSRSFQPLEKAFDETFQFVGPIIYDRKEKQPVNVLKQNVPIIYVALGTVYNDNVSLYRSIIASLGKLGFPSYISIGKYISPSQLGAIPSNIHIAPYFPQLEMLKKASLFISHAGMNSVNESLYFGVPLLMLPIIQEQKINATRVEELGAGLYYRKRDIKTADFIETIQSMLKEKKYKENAEQVGQALSAAGGAKKAVEHILKYIS